MAALSDLVPEVGQVRICPLDLEHKEDVAFTISADVGLSDQINPFGGLVGGLLRIDFELPIGKHGKVMGVDIL